MAGLLLLLAIALALLVLLLSTILIYEMRHPPRRSTGYAIAHRLPADPADLNLPFTSWPLHLEKSTSLPIWDITGSAPASSSPLTAVLLHGWGHARLHSLQRISPFLPHCHRLLLPDLRGHGDASSSSRLGHREHLDLIALLHAAHACTLDRPPQLPSAPLPSHMREEEGGWMDRTISNSASPSRFLLVGHSMGAVICLAAAAHFAHIQHPLSSSIAGIIAYAPYTSFRRSLIGRLAVARFPTFPMTDFALAFHRLTGLVPLSLDPGSLRVITCPVLIIHGESDAVAPLPHAQLIASAIPSARLHVIPDADHLSALTVDSHARDLVLHQFLSSLAHLPSTPLSAR